MRDSKYPVTAEALADGVVYSIPNDDYRQLLRNDPDACLRLLGEVGRGADVAGQIAQVTGQRDAGANRRASLVRLDPGKVVEPVQEGHRAQLAQRLGYPQADIGGARDQRRI